MLSGKSIFEGNVYRMASVNLSDMSVKKFIAYAMESVACIELQNVYKDLAEIYKMYAGFYNVCLRKKVYKVIRSRNFQ